MAETLSGLGRLTELRQRLLFVLSRCLFTAWAPSFPYRA
jgi:hypothetical protein